MTNFTHFDDSGRACMVDIGGKQETERRAVAAGWISMSETAYNMVKKGTAAKGDVLGIARIAGIMAAKKTPDLIPLCHPLAINNVTVDFTFDERLCRLEIYVTVGTTGRTGVEMEALAAVSVAALTVYDMCKAVDKSMTIGDIRLLKKRGGKSGSYSRK